MASTEPLYKNATMVGNWWEDRHMPKERLTTAERVLSVDPRSSQLEATTTKREYDSGMLTAKPLVAQAQAAKRNAPSLYPSEQTVRNRLDTYMPSGRAPDEIAYTLGRTMVQEASQPPVRYLETTHRTYHKDFTPETTGRGQALDRTHFRKPLLATEVVAHVAEGEDRSRDDLPRRGELTRRPREAGNPYGISVFVDEYAQWGRKLGGNMTLGDTVSRKMTSYF